VIKNEGNYAGGTVSRGVFFSRLLFLRVFIRNPNYLRARLFRFPIEALGNDGKKRKCIPADVGFAF